MKWFLAIFAVVAAAQALPREQSLSAHFRDFDVMASKNPHMREVFMQHMQDPKLRQSMAFFGSREFAQLVQDVERAPETKAVVKFLVDSGLDVHTFLAKLNSYLGIEEYKPSLVFLLRGAGSGFAGLIKDLASVIEYEEISALYQEKLRTSSVFSRFVERVYSPEARRLVGAFVANPAVRKAVVDLEAHGIPAKDSFDLVVSFYGFGDYSAQSFPSLTRDAALTRNLQSDLDDFMALVPQKEVEDLFYEYLVEDEEFQEALDYAMGEDFKGLVKLVEGMPEFRRFLQFVEERGVSAYQIVNDFNKFLDIPAVAPKFRRSLARISGGLSGFLKDVQAMVPEAKVQALFKQKMSSSKDFKELVAKIESDEARQFLAKLKANPKVQEVDQRLKEKGVNVQELLQTVASLVGVKLPL